MQPDDDLFWNFISIQRIFPRISENSKDFDANDAEVIVFQRFSNLEEDFVQKLR